MTTNALTRTGRHFPLLALAGLLLAGAAALTVGAQGTAAAMSAYEQRPDLSVTQTSTATLNGLMPGGQATLTFDVRADMDIVYAFDATTTGAGPLAEQLHAVVRTSSGEALYEGPLGEAAFSGRTLAGGQLDQIVVEVELPLDTTETEAAGSGDISARFTAARP